MPINAEVIVQIEYSYAEAIKLGVGVRFLSMRRKEIGNVAKAFFMFPVHPGEPYYDASAFEVWGIPINN